MKIDNNLRHERCPLCLSANISKVGEIAYSLPHTFSSKEVSLVKKPELWKCRCCVSAFTQNAVPEHVASSLYECGIGGDRWAAEPFAVAKHRIIIKTLDELFQKKIKVLDIGCNTGELLDYAKEKGCRTSGVEFCQSSRQLIEHKGHESFPSILEAPGSYDVITAFDLVEHLYDVPAFLNMCRQKLSDEGRIVLLTGNISSLSARIAGSDWWYVKYPEHIVFPTKKYFTKYSELRIQHWIHTYASLEFESSLSYSLKSLLHGLLERNYTALPSIVPDHILVVLGK